MKNFPAGWYVIYTRPRHEKKVSVRLHAMGINCFLPLTRTCRVSGVRKKYAEVPLFPSYVFLYLQNMEEFYSGSKIDGALYYVRTGKEVAIVSEDTIRNVRVLVQHRQELEVSASHFRPGRKVVINHGALADLRAEIVEVEGEEKILVRMHILQRNILMRIPAEYLSVAMQ